MNDNTEMIISTNIMNHLQDIGFGNQVDLVIDHLTFVKLVVSILYV
jgi:hypothetical protein